MSSSTPTLPTNIGFIGLGNMGFPMFCNLAKKIPSSSKVHIYDVSDDAMEKALHEPVVEGMFQKCTSCREVAERSDIVISIVPEGSHVRSVYLTPETGVLAADIGSKILLDSSTIDIATSLKVREETLSRHPKASFYDTPVSGGMRGAQVGTLTIMVGCTPKDPKLPLLTELYSTMATNIVPCGGPSLGLTAKFCNNYLSSSITLLNSEMFNVAIKSGMDPRILQSILATSTGCNRNAQIANPVPGLSPKVPASNGYKPGFKIEYVKKDLGLAIDAAKRVDAKLFAGPAVYDAYVRAGQDERCAGMDSKVIYRWIGGDENWAEKFK